MGNNIVITTGSEKCVNEKSDLGRVGRASRINVRLEGGVSGGLGVRVHQSKTFLCFSGSYAWFYICIDFKISLYSSSQWSLATGFNVSESYRN